MTEVKSRVWCGAVSILDGVIEEVHTYEEAKRQDFHHTFIFSEAMVEKIDTGECLFFSIEPNGVQLGWTDRLDQESQISLAWIRARVEDQLRGGDWYEDIKSYS